MTGAQRKAVARAIDLRLRACGLRLGDDRGKPSTSGIPLVRRARPNTARVPWVDDTGRFDA